MSYRNDNGPVIIGGLIVALLIVVGIVFTIASHLNVQVRDCTIKDKYAVSKSDEATKYRVETSCGVMEVQDTLLRMKFDSADRYASLDEGKNYELTTIGYRIPVLSAFPNIIEIKE